MTCNYSNSEPIVEQNLHLSYHQAPGYLVSELLIAINSSDESKIFPVLASTLYNAFPGEELASKTAAHILDSLGFKETVPSYAVTV